MKAAVILGQTAEAGHSAYVLDDRAVGTPFFLRVIVLGVVGMAGYSKLPVLTGREMIPRMGNVWKYAGILPQCHVK